MPAKIAAFRLFEAALSSHGLRFAPATQVSGGASPRADLSQNHAATNAENADSIWQVMLIDFIFILYQKARRYLTWSQILACGVTHCVVLHTCSASAQELKTFIDEKYGFRVQYPDEWQEQNTVGANIRLLVESKTSDGCFFHVGVAPNTKGYMPSKLVDIVMAPGEFERVLVKGMPRAKVLSIQRGAFANQEGIIFTYELEPVGLKIMQQGIGAVTWKDGFSYGGNCVTAPSRFAATKLLFQGILATFIFTTPMAR
jgi:hypothetical protein